MENQDKAWREIQMLIERDKAAALEEFRRLPFRPEAPVRPPAWFRLHPALAAVAASLLLVATLAALWLLRGGWQDVALPPAGSDCLAGSLFFAAAGQADAAADRDSRVTASPYFTALAEMALRPRAAAREGTEAEAASRAVVERGDPNEVRRAIANAIRGNAFERALVEIQKFHAQEA